MGLLEGLERLLGAKAPAPAPAKKSPNLGTIPQLPAAGPRPNVPQTVDRHATDLPNVLGNLVFHNVAKAQGFTPFFSQLVQNTHPQVLDGKQFSDFSGDPEADASYNPDSNRLAISGAALGQKGLNYGVTHEGLHAAYNQLSPQGMGDFAQLAQNNISPSDRRNLTGIVGGYGYKGNFNNFKSAPVYAQNEAHSYLPLSQNTMSNNAPLRSYYGQYYSNPNF